MAVAGSNNAVPCLGGRADVAADQHGKRIST
jgi:hypothetical protein